MWPVLLAFAVFATSGAKEGTDVVLDVSSGTRFELTNHNGDIRIEAWKRNAVRVAADHSPGVHVDVQQRRGTVSVGAATGRGLPSVDYFVQVPEWMALEIHGVNSAISISGVSADVSAYSVNGDVTLAGGKGRIDLSSTNGGVRITGASGRAKISAINDDLHVERFRGAIYAETVNGDVILSEVQSDSVLASTVSGDVAYRSPLRKGGIYRLSTHSGDVFLGVATNADATVSVSTYGGEFHSNLNVRQPRKPRKHGHHHGSKFSFQLGDGSARVTLETFDGDIVVRRLR